MFKYVIFIVVLLHSVHNGSMAPFLLGSRSLFGGSSTPTTTPQPEDSKYIEKIPPKSQKQIQAFDQGESYPNEISAESPSILQHKIQTILQKFVTLSQLHNAVQGGLDDTMNENNFKYENLEDLGESESDDFIGDDEQINPNVAQFARTIPRSDDNKPLRIQISTEHTNTNEPSMEGMDEKNTFGYFILESLASLVGLTVGAFTHIQYILTHNSTAT